MNTFNIIYAFNNKETKQMNKELVIRSFTLTVCQLRPFVEWGGI